MMFSNASKSEPRGVASLERAFAYCEKLAKAHYENFTVGSWLLPKSKRQHVFNIYAYCRLVDDLGDELKGDRLSALDAWEEELHLCYRGVPRHPVLIALQQTIESHQIPIEPFLKLIKANRLDQERRRHSSYEDLLYYCDHSANPCGRLFLYIFGYRDEERQARSDATCTALQLTNFWQDIAIDWRKERVYIPQEDLTHFGYSEQELARGTLNDAFRKLMKFEVGRTRQLFQKGLTLLEHVDRKIKIDIELFNRGGLAILDRIEKAGYDVFQNRPSLTRLGKIKILIQCLARRRS